MSSYIKLTRHPETKEFQPAFWIDDMFGNHRYGVVFLNGDCWQASYYDWKTKNTNVDSNWDKYPKELNFKGGKIPRSKL